MQYKCYFGDIHNHCNASYGHGDLEDALENAKLQLDFVSITGHSSWPDIPDTTPELESVIDYHKRGFSKLEKRWANFVQLIKSYNRGGRFVAFPSYEVHSLTEGDYTIYFKDNLKKMFKPKSIAELQKIVLEERRRGGKAFIVPHHIGYKKGFRGINWDTYNEHASPLIEIVSMHGCSESDNAAFPYLHTMGPRNGKNTMQTGLSMGYHFGVIGSTDHHSAHPGSNGYGRVAVWAEELTESAIWSALENRRCYAVTGDRIIFNYSVNDAAMGEIIPFVKQREHKISLTAGDTVDYVELLKNNTVVKRYSFPFNSHDTGGKGRLKGKLFIEVGWGEYGIKHKWNIKIRVDGGHILDVEPRFHGRDTVDPKINFEGNYRFSEWERSGDEVRLITETWGNPTTLTNANQGICLEIDCSPKTKIVMDINHKIFSTDISKLLECSDSFYLDKFLSAAVHVNRFVLENEYKKELTYTDYDNGKREDFYYVRVKQYNGQWAYSSPIWVRGLE
ncbi:MAG: hypothetical protein DRP57_10610 [Spirochaetes bacterium]|nr:MAG: hypothetical protein DRP57_10610 [Spirochaetota bacterium]